MGILTLPTMLLIDKRGRVINRNLHISQLEDELKKLHGKIIQAAKRKNDTLRRQYHHAQAQAFPAGHPQERADPPTAGARPPGRA